MRERSHFGQQQWQAAVITPLDKQWDVCCNREIICVQCNQMENKSYMEESQLEEKGWIKISRDVPYTYETLHKRHIYTHELKMTKKQADALIDLGFSSDEDFKFLVQVNGERW